jgi:ABC-type dipeptide/oligopeptide/nickel transport system permease component
MLFLVAQVIQLNISVTLALALFALVAAIISVSLGMYGVLRTKRWPFRLVNAVAVVASLFAILAWGSLILTLASGCLGVMC